MKVYFEKLQARDYHLGYLELLEQLTTVDAKSISYEDFKNQLKQINANIYLMKIEVDKSVKIVGSGTLLIEKKFIHKMSSVAHIEDIVVDKSMRGHGLGRMMIEYLIETAKTMSDCYKIILDCSDDMVKFYQKCGFELKGRQMSIYL